MAVLGCHHKGVIEVIACQAQLRFHDSDGGNRLLFGSFAFLQLGGRSCHVGVDSFPLRLVLEAGALGSGCRFQYCGLGRIRLRLPLLSIFFRTRAFLRQAFGELLKAGLAAAKQDVLMYKADLEAAEQKVVRSKSELEYAKYQQQLSEGLAQKGAGPEEDAQKWQAQTNATEAAVLESTAGAERSRLKYESQWEGVNTNVATAAAQLKESEAAEKQAVATISSVRAQLDLARYYLDNTLMVAPEDGHIVNLQVRPGMVSGIIRMGGIASFIVDSDRYLLASFTQENLKYVKIGQPVEVAMDLYPGQIFDAKVDSIWWANGQGQYLPSDIIPQFDPANPMQPQGEFAVKIYLNKLSKAVLPIGAQGAAAIYTSGGGFAALRKITIRMHTWTNWLYPMPFA